MAEYIIVNNTSHNLRAFDSVFSEAVRNGGCLPDELSDIFEMRISQTGDTIVGAIFWKDN